MAASAAPLDQALSLLRRHGWNATSFQVLGTGLRHWFADDACIGYLDTGRCWVVAGAPIAASARLAEVTDAFCRDARAKGRRTVFFATEDRFIDAVGLPALAIGEQPVWDPAEWVDIVAQSRSLRDQFRRAQNRGVLIERIEADAIEDPSSNLRHAIQRLIDDWANQKPLPPMGFLVRVNPFSFPRERRMFIAKLRGELVGFAGAVPVYARNGWFIEDLIRAPTAPNGTVELLVDAAMRDAAALGSHYVTLGLAPLSGAVERGLRLVRRHTLGLYDFEGLRAFKAKFRPRAWVPISVAFPPDTGALRAIHHSLVAFSRVGLMRFGIEAFLRGPDVVVRILALLLIPWTLLLGLVDVEPWFLVPELKWFWICFDLVLCACLFAVGYRRRRWVVRLALGMVSFDAAATTLQALFIDVNRVATPLEAGLLAVAISAPLLAFAVLLNLCRRMEHSRCAQQPVVP